MADIPLLEVCTDDRGCFSNTASDRLRPVDDRPTRHRSSLPPARVPLDPPPVGARRSARAPFGRWLLDLVVVSFAHGGGMHHAHPDYVAFLRDLDGTARRPERLR